MMCAVEDEYHFVIICPAYENLREKFMPNKLLKFTSILIFRKLMASRDLETNKGLALYIKVAMKLRQDFPHLKCYNLCMENSDVPGVLGGVCWRLIGGGAGGFC